MLRSSACRHVGSLLLALVLSGCATTAKPMKRASESRNSSADGVRATGTPALTLIDGGFAFAPATSAQAPSPGPAIGARMLGASGDAGTADRRETLIATPVAQFAILETVMGIDALLFSYNPRPWGAFAALFMVAPGAAMIADRTGNPVEPWLFLAGAGALVAYDLKVDHTRTSQSEIFKTNFAGMNAIVAALFTMKYLAGNSTPVSKFSLAYVPESRGGRLLFTYRF